jgi:hypothetical protein
MIWELLPLVRRCFTTVGLYIQCRTVFFDCEASTLFIIPQHIWFGFSRSYSAGIYIPDEQKKDSCY